MPQIKKLSLVELKKLFLELDSKVIHDANSITSYTTKFQYSGLFRYQEMVFRINFNESVHGSSSNSKTIEQLTIMNGFIQLASKNDINFTVSNNFSKLDGYQKTCDSFVESSKRYINMMFPIKI